jgi:hypothetical protein
MNFQFFFAPRRSVKSDMTYNPLESFNRLTFSGSYPINAHVSVTITSAFLTASSGILVSIILSRLLTPTPVYLIISFINFVIS